jgi:hypothetical protein
MESEPSINLDIADLYAPFREKISALAVKSGPCWINGIGVR